jgi:glycosyltransferase involved in cell wall biosynthesis
MRNTKLAVLLAVYKNDNVIHLDEAIQSLLFQTINDFSIFILVDGPIPKPIKLCLAKYEAKSFIKLFYFTKNRGLPTVLNDGVNYCLENGYEYIARMDADDICKSIRFEKQLNFLKNNLKTDVVGGYIEEFTVSTNKKRVVKFPLTHIECKKNFKYRDPFAHPSVMFRKSFFEKAGLYDISLKGINNWDDTGLWYSGFKNGCNFANIPNVVLEFRINDDFYSGRRNGLKRALAYTKFRYNVNLDLKNGFSSQMFLIPRFLLNVAPVFLKKIAYSIFRK